MSCSHRDLHIDLLFGEIPAAEARELRAAIELCSECAADFAMMEGIESLSADALRVEAPQGLDELIMAAAHAAHAPKPAKDVPATEGARPGIWARLVAFVEGAAIGPQFAMATVMLLVVAVGLWYVPKRESREVLGSTVVIADPDGEAVASADDPSVREREPPLLAPAQRETLEPDPGNEEVAQLERPGATTRREAETPRIRPPASTNTERLDTESAAEGVASTMAMLDEGIEDAVSQANAWAEEMGAAEALPSYEDNTAAGSGVPSAQRSAAQRPSAQRPSAQPSPQPAPSQQPQYRSVAPMQEVPAPNPTSLSRALLQLARNHRTQGACQEAVRHYEELLRRYASAPEVPQALVEAGDCYRRLGRLSDSERVLRRALVYASSRQTAQRELTRLETLRAAQRRRSRAPARTSEAAEAAPAEASY